MGLNEPFIERPGVCQFCQYPAPLNWRDLTSPGRGAIKRGAWACDCCAEWAATHVMEYGFDKPEIGAMSWHTNRLLDALGNFARTDSGEVIWAPGVRERSVIGTGPERRQ